eukprot:15158974-Ditylum_brightwellii.AAC.1
MGTTPSATTKAIMCKDQEATVQVQTEIDMLEACRTILSARHTTTIVPDVTPVKLFETKLVNLDLTLAEHTIIT